MKKSASLGIASSCISKPYGAEQLPRGPNRTKVGGFNVNLADDRTHECPLHYLSMTSVETFDNDSLPQTRPPDEDRRNCSSH